jgi:hypothetical protein
VEIRRGGKRSSDVRRRVAALLTVAVAGAVAYAITRGPSGGLMPIDEMNVGFGARCGQTVTWEAAVVANTSKTPLVVESARLVDPPRGFSMAYARGYVTRRNASADDDRARTPLAGIRIEPTPPSHVGAWHFVVGIRTPFCPPAARRQRSRFSNGPSWLMARHTALIVSYSVGGDHRSARIGGATVICTAPRHYRCHLPEPLPT